MLDTFEQQVIRKTNIALRPMLWGQIVQALTGLALAVYACKFWLSFNISSAGAYGGLFVDLYNTVLVVASAVLLSMRPGSAALPLMQILWAAGLSLIFASVWLEHRAQTLLVLSGMLLQLYGITLMIISAQVLRKLAALNNARTLTLVRQALGQLRLTYVRSSVLAGLPWWVLWMPAAAVAVKSIYALDLYAYAPLATALSFAFGVAGLAYTAWLHHRARQAPSNRANKALDAAWSGSSLLRAEVELERANEALPQAGRAAGKQQRR